MCALTYLARSTIPEKKWAYYSQSIITVFEIEHDPRIRMNNLKQQYKDIDSPTSDT